MGKLFNQIDQRLEEFILAQQMFFVATAPLSATGVSGAEEPDQY